MTLVLAFLGSLHEIVYMLSGHVDYSVLNLQFTLILIEFCEGSW